MFRNNIRQANDYLLTMKCPKCGKTFFYAKPKPDKCPECGAPIGKSGFDRFSEMMERMKKY